MKSRRLNQTVSVLDVAAYVLANHTRNTPILAWKMHKLMYYCQVCLLVRDGYPFFHEKIMASPKGIVIEELCGLHYGQLYVGDSSKGNLNHLSLRQIDVIDEVMKKYGVMSLEALDELSKNDSPWKAIRDALDPKSKASIEITPESIQKYYNTHKL